MNAYSGGMCLWLHRVWQTRGLDKAWGEEGAGLGGHQQACRLYPGWARGGRTPRAHMGQRPALTLPPQLLRSNYWTDLTVLCIQMDTNGGHCPTGLFFSSDSSPHTLCLNCQQQDCGAFHLPEGHPSSLAVHPEGSQLGCHAQARLGRLGGGARCGSSSRVSPHFVIKHPRYTASMSPKRFIFIRT